MKEEVLFIVNEYLNLFPNEKKRLSLLLDYLSHSTSEEITDWNNQKGHLTVGAFLYCKAEDKFLVLYHKDLKMYLYPGGHIDEEDKSLIEAAKRELKEETALEKLKLFLVNKQEIPFDIDIHTIPFNERILMPEHYHFDFRYLFLISNIKDIVFDEQEFNDYKWISSKELSKDKNYGDIINKIKQFFQ